MGYNRFVSEILPSLSADGYGFWLLCFQSCIPVPPFGDCFDRLPVRDMPGGFVGGVRVRYDASFGCAWEGLQRNHK